MQQGKLRGLHPMPIQHRQSSSTGCDAVIAKHNCWHIQLAQAALDGHLCARSAVRCKPGVEILRTREIEQGFCQRLQLLLRQRLDASRGGCAEGAAASV